MLLSLYLKLRAVVLDGWGGLNLANIESGLRLFNIPPSLRPKMTMKLLWLIEKIREKDQADV